MVRPHQTQDALTHRTKRRTFRLTSEFWAAKQRTPQSHDSTPTAYLHLLFETAQAAL